MQLGRFRRMEVHLLHASDATLGAPTGPRVTSSRLRPEGRTGHGQKIPGKRVRGSPPASKGIVLTTSLLLTVVSHKIGGSRAKDPR